MPTTLGNFPGEQTVDNNLFQFRTAYGCDSLSHFEETHMEDISAELAALRQSIDRQSELQEETNAIMRGLMEALKALAQEIADSRG